MRFLILLLTIIGGSCARYNPTELHTLCVRYVDREGYMRGRPALYNSEGASKVSRLFPFTQEGVCMDSNTGQPQRITVCLARSSPCHHDRTTNLYEDQIPQYFERYPGSYRGECTSDCSEHRDDCLDAGRAWKGIEDWDRWMKWMRGMDRARMRRMQ